MDFEQLIKHRFSSRSYHARDVPQEHLDKVLNAARLAPSAANRQPFRLLVIPTEGRRDELLQIYNRDWFVQPPLVIGILGFPEEGWVRHKSDGQNYTWVDAAIAFDHLTLQAAELGLGTCWIAAFNPEAARTILEIPEEAVPVAFTPLGFPQDSAGPKTRKSLDELVQYHR